MRARLGVLVSGGGTNLQALLDRAAEPDYPAEVVLVVADRHGTGAEERGRAAGTSTAVVRLEDHPDREAFTEAILETARGHGVDILVSAGFGKLMSGAVFKEYPLILNVHPALLPAFPGPGRRVLRETLEYGVKVSGVTVHFLDDGVDTGPIVLQEAVAVEEDDTVDSLYSRIKGVEHRLLPEAVRLQALGRITVDGRRVRIASDP